MKRYICKEKQRDGWIISKAWRKRIATKQMGVAHNEEELKTLIVLAENEVKDKQQKEFNFVALQEDRTKIEHKESYSKYLYDRVSEAKLDLINIDKQIRIVLLQIENNTLPKKPGFLKLTGSKKELDKKLIKISRLKAGIKGYVTNLDYDAQTIIDGHHNLFSVEKSFRMSKSDLKARPIFHQTRDSIEAHLTICFAAIGICRYIQDRTNISIKRFIRKLERLRTAIIQIGDNEYTAEPKIDI
ncbi:MAG: hypothetical protein LBT79_00790, partial [Elusimicrobiota bacterium]|nr:hypothetical protein [Elusimicrobiota bacterium]